MLTDTESKGIDEIFNLINKEEELKQKGINVSLSRLIHELNNRDVRDLTRKSSPLIIPTGAVVIDTDNLSIGEVIDQVTKHIKQLVETKK